MTLNHSLQEVKAAESFLMAYKHIARLANSKLFADKSLKIKNIDQLTQISKNKFLDLFSPNAKQIIAEFYDKATIWQRANPDKSLAELLQF